MLVLLPLLGAVLGALIAGALVHARLRDTAARERATLAAELAARASALAVEKASLEERARRIPGLELQLQQSSQTVVDLKGRVKELETLASEQRRGWEEKAHLLQESKEQLLVQFKALASDALKANSTSFLELASQSQASFEGLVKPVQETLSKLEEKVQKADMEREGSYQALIAQMRAVGEGTHLVRTEAGKLVQALKTPNVRGRWGEIELRRIVEHAGLTKEVSFVEQETHGDTERIVRPDMIVKLPNGRSVVVDAKVPLDAYLAAMDVPDESTRARKMREHAAALQRKIDDLASKDYASSVDGAIDLVVLFLPAEGFVHAAFDADLGLMERALEKKVAIATPMTLIALLKAIAFGWRQESLAKNAEEVSELGAELYYRLATMGEHFGKVGRMLEGATRAYNETVGSLEGRVFSAARKLKELKAAKSGKDVEELKPVELAARSLQRPELVAVSSVARVAG
jgi:DNA recombination protein RmuC